MRRDVNTRPGYDCIGAPCRFTPPCTPGNSHGMHGDEWVYSVTSDDGATALVLTVFTDIFPETVGAARLRAFRGRALADRRTGADLTMHMAVNDTTGRLVEADESKHNCTYVRGGQCYVWETTGLGADELFRAVGNPAARAQSEAFWLALEQRFAEADRRIRATFITSTEPTAQERHAGVGALDHFDPSAGPPPTVTYGVAPEPARSADAAPPTTAARPSDGRTLTYAQIEELARLR